MKSQKLISWVLVSTMVFSSCFMPKISWAENVDVEQIANVLSEVKEEEITIPSPESTITPTAEVIVGAAVTPTVEATVEVTVVPTMVPTVEATAVPTEKATIEVTAVPTMAATVEATVVPAEEATVEVTAIPTMAPTVEATAAPTIETTIETTVAPTADITIEPTGLPTPETTVESTIKPTAQVTSDLTVTPEVEKTIKPTVSPTNTVIATATTVPTADITPFPADENPLEQEWEMQGEIFKEGYVSVKLGAELYESMLGNKVIGRFTGPSVVYAQCSQNADNLQDMWLWIIFDTQESRDKNEALIEGYLKYESVTPLTPAEAQAYALACEEKNICRGYKGNLIDAVPYSSEVQDGKDISENHKNSNNMQSSDLSTEEIHEGMQQVEPIPENIENMEDELPVIEKDEEGSDITLSAGDETKTEKWPEVTSDAMADSIDIASNLDPCEVTSVWYDRGVEKKPLMIHATTNMDAQYLVLYLGDAELARWSTEEANITENVYNKEWHVSYTFEESGAYYLSYRASNDGVAMSDYYVPEPVMVERPAIIGVWYDAGIEKLPLQIHVTTNLNMQYLSLYMGDTELASWNASEADIVEYATCKDWNVSYTFDEPGPYYLWYKATSDGVTEEIPFSQTEPVMIERPAIIGVWYDQGIEKTPMPIHVTTNLKMQEITLLLGDTVLQSWNADEADIVEYATCKDWNVSYTFDEPGPYYLWYKATSDGVTEELPYSDATPIVIERPAIISVWYEEVVPGLPLRIHATTNLEMEYLYLNLGDEILATWTAENAEITEYATCKDWVVEYDVKEPGAYYFWYKASEDGTTEEIPFATDPVIIGEVNSNLPAPIWQPVEQTGSSVVLRWQAVEGAAGYYVYMAESNSEELSLIADIEGLDFLEYRIDDLVAGMTYSFQVSAYEIREESKIESQHKSEVITVTIMEQIETEDGYSYIFAEDGAGVIITSYTGEAPNAVIPTTIADVPVVAIGDQAFSENQSLISVVIPDSITSIGSGAFYNCTGLQSIEITGAVTIIREYTFENCTSLAEVVLPNSVTVIGQGAFKNCSSLTSMNCL